MTDRTYSWKRRVSTGAFALALAGLLGVGTASAGHGRHGCEGRGHDKLAEKIQGLGLNTESQAAVDQVLEQARTTREAQRQELRAAHEQMRTLLDQDAPALDAVMAHADSIGALETQARKQKLETMLALRALIGVEQWQKLDFGRGGKHGFGKDHGRN